MNVEMVILVASYMVILKSHAVLRVLSTIIFWGQLPNSDQKNLLWSFSVFLKSGTKLPAKVLYVDTGCRHLIDASRLMAGIYQHKCYKIRLLWANDCHFLRAIIPGRESDWRFFHLSLLVITGSTVRKHKGERTKRLSQWKQQTTIMELQPT